MNNPSRKVLSLALAVVMMVTLFAISPVTANAADIGVPSGTHPAINVATGTVYYGGRLYRVVENDGTTMTLFCDGSIGNMQYDSSGQHKNWSGSSICDYLNTTFLSTFSAAEQAAIGTYGTTEQANLDYVNTTTIDISQKIVLPSVHEVGWYDNSIFQDMPGTWNLAPADRTFSDYWWLRSPGDHSSNDSAACVDSGGNVLFYGNDVFYPSAIRPAFKLNLSSVIFTSAASGASGKSSAAVGGGLVGASAPTGAVKLTVTDATNLSLTCTDTATRTVASGGTVEIDYTGAATGANRFVSCVITNSSGAVLFYGKLATAASGTSNFTVPPASALPAGDYTIKLFNEECNADNSTDFASAPVSIPLTVDNTAPILTAGAVSRTSDADATVKFTSDEAGTYYHQLDGTAPTNAAALVSAGTNSTALTAAEQTITFAAMSAGAHTVYVAAKDAAGNVSNMLTISIPAYVPPSTAPTITGPSTMTLTAGYAATQTGAFSITGTAPVTVTKTSGDAKITWNDTDKKLDIAAGLAAGTYTVKLTATNGTAPNAAFTFTLTVNAASNPPPPAPTYTQRTLRHAPTGVTVSGLFTADAALVVTKNALHEKGTCPACDEIRKSGSPVALYEISTTGGHSGNLTLAIPVPSGYNGQSMLVRHCKQNHVEEVTLTAKDGFVTGTFSSLSPFAVFATGGGSAPQTGDTSNLGLWVALLCASLAALGGLAVWYVVRRRRKLS